MRELVVKKNDANQRLDKFLLKKFKTMPKKMAYMYIRKKCVKVNGKKATPEVMLKENDLLTFYIKDEFFDNIQEENYEFLKAPKNLKIIYEDENVTAFKDLNPQAPIHILVVPKKHYDNVLDVEENDNIISKIYEAINKIAKKEGFAKEGFRVINNCGENAGQTVMHMHFHIIAGKKLGEGIV